MDKIPQTVTGKWIWREDTMSLEFLPSTMQFVDQKDKKARKKNFVVSDQGNRQENRATPNWFSSKAIPATGIGTATKSQKHDVRPAKSAKEKETVVTLERVKAVTLNLLHEVNVNTDAFERALFGLEQFNEFLYGLLNYFAAFFDKLALGKPKQAMATEPSQAEIRAIAEIESSLSTAKKKLARSYSVLLLGIGLPENHHMGCGGQRVSSTYRDRTIYESLYRFCVGFIWVAFYRKEQELISQEVGRLLRSDVFNPALRVKQNTTNEDFKDGTTTPKDHTVKGAPHQRQTEKRPAITSIINKRSPVIVSLLPTPKEKNEWLFDRLDPSMSNREEEIEKPTSFKKRVGIIGEPLDLFNASTLTPLDAEQEEESSPENQSHREGTMAGTPVKNGTSTGRHLSGQSQTTDVFTDDEEP